MLLQTHLREQNLVTSATPPCTNARSPNDSPRDAAFLALAHHWHTSSSHALSCSTGSIPFTILRCRPPPTLLVAAVVPRCHHPAASAPRRPSESASRLSHAAAAGARLYHMSSTLPPHQDTPLLWQSYNTVALQAIAVFTLTLDRRGPLTPLRHCARLWKMTGGCGGWWCLYALPDDCPVCSETSWFAPLQPKHWQPSSATQGGA